MTGDLVCEPLITTLVPDTCAEEGATVAAAAPAASGDAVAAVSTASIFTVSVGAVTVSAAYPAPKEEIHEQQLEAITLCAAIRTCLGF